MPTNPNDTLSQLIDEAKHCINQGYYEEAIFKLREGLNLNPKTDDRLAVLDNLGYCFLSVGWCKEATDAYTKILEINPSDNDARFFRASAYLSLRWTDEAIGELRIILATDPADVLARHDLALCYHNKGWLKESLEEMKIARAFADTYGNQEEKEIVESSLKHLEEEIEDGDKDGSKAAFRLLVLMHIIKERLRRRN